MRNAAEHKDFSLNTKILLSIFTLTFLSTVSYSVFYSSLTTMLNESYGFSGKNAASVCGLFLGLNYVFQLVSGWFISRKLFSNEKLFVVGSICQALGSLLLLYEDEKFAYLGLSCFLMQSLGCIVTVNMAITEHVKDGAKRSEIFTWNLVAMNLAFVIGYFIAGSMQLIHNYQPFLKISSALGIASSLIGFIYWRKYHTNLGHNNKSAGYKLTTMMYSVIILITYFSFEFSNISKLIIMLVSIFIFVFAYIKLFAKADSLKAKNNTSLFGITIIQNIIYWSVYFLSSTFLFTYIEKNVDTMIMGAYMPAQWLLEASPFMVVISGAVLATTLRYLRNKKMVKLSVTQHFAAGFIVLSIGLLLFSLGCYNANYDRSVLKYCVIAFIITSAIAETIVVPKGYSSIGEFVPEESQPFFMGCWSLLPGTGALIASYLSSGYLMTALEMPLVKSDIRIATTYFALFIIILFSAYLARISTWLINRKYKTSN